MRSRTVLAVVALGVALVLPSVRAGFFADDYLQIAQRLSSGHRSRGGEYVQILPNSMSKEMSARPSA